ncbi:MAG: hypothetical protein VZR95_01120 [Alphaproteobacteria bacterium]
MPITKQEAVQQILGIMQDNNITVADITATIKAQSRPQVQENFDLLCEINGIRKRLPFDTGKDLNPIAIFPRQNLKFFLSLEETGMISYPAANEKEQLADEDLCTLLMEVRPELNEKLRELGKPIVSGDYWLNGHELSGVGYWMARIREDQLKVDYFDASKKAKVRHIGHL